MCNYVLNYNRVYKIEKKLSNHTFYSINTEPHTILYYIINLSIIKLSIINLSIINLSIINLSIINL